MANKQNSMIDSSDIQAGYDLGRAPDELREGGIDVDDIEIIPEARLFDEAEKSRFMEEKVIIEIDQDDDPNSPIFAYSAHNGVTQYIERGRPQAIKRKYLYSMIAAKQVNMACKFFRDANGNDVNRLTPNARNTYRVRLIRDDNPEGVKWLAHVMKNSG